MYIKTSCFIININPLIKKILNRQRPYRKYWFNIVDDKKDLKIWWDSPFKKGRCFRYADDDEVRTIALQNHVTTTLCTWEILSQDTLYSSPSYQQRGVGGGGGWQEKDGQWDTYRRFQLSFSSQLDLHTAERGLQNLYHYFVTGENEYNQFFIYVETVRKPNMAGTFKAAEAGFWTSNL